MDPLTPEQELFAIRCMETYATIASETRGGIGPADPIHSGLLLYLLRGNKPFEKPPPKSYSRPAYELAEGKRCLVGLYQRMFGLEKGDLPTIYIDQCGDWEWHDVDKFIIKHTISGDLYKFEEATAKEIVSSWTYLTKVSDEQKIKDAQLSIVSDRKEGMLRGFLQRIDGEAPRKE